MLHHVFSSQGIQLALLGISFYVVQCKQYDDNAGRRVAKQTSASVIGDQSSAESGFGGGGGVEHSKYFQYQHNPEHDKYEFGFRRGNEHHFKERYEKAAPHEGHFKTKVRWGDKKGGYGEHYWDYNHAGDGGDGEGGFSDPVPAYSVQDGDDDRSKSKRQLAEPIGSATQVQRRQYVENTPIETTTRISTRKNKFVSSFEDEIGAIENFDIQKEGQPAKRNTDSKPVDAALAKAIQIGKEIQANGSPQLYFDLDSGKVIDEKTGKTYILQPYDN